MTNRNNSSLSPQLHRSTFITNLIEESVNSLLKISKQHNKLIHPCQERTKYAHVLEWMVTKLQQLLSTPQHLQHINSSSYEDSSFLEVLEEQQKIMMSTLVQMIELTSKQCIEKGIILQMVMQYLMSTINSCWSYFKNANQQNCYEYEARSLKIEKQYIEKIKSQQLEIECMKKDKEHRWRNMYMLIKDNRILRKQNKKLLQTVAEQRWKNQSLIEEILMLRNQNLKIKIMIASQEEQNDKLEEYMQAKIKILALENTLISKQKKAKKLLKNQLIKIEIREMNTLNDKIQFIIKAIEETGEIVDQFNQDERNWAHFTFNISTQTEISTEDKAINTISVKTQHIEVMARPQQLLLLEASETVCIKLKPQVQIQQRRHGESRQSKNVMFSNTSSFNSKNNLKAQSLINKARFTFKKIEGASQNLSIREALKITIFHSRISYISTQNLEIRNGLELAKEKPFLLKKESLKNVGLDKQIQTVDDFYEIQKEEEEMRLMKKLQMLKTSGGIKQRSTFCNISQLKEVFSQNSTPKSESQKNIWKVVDLLYDPYSKNIKTNNNKQNPFNKAKNIMDSRNQSLFSLTRLNQNVLIYKENSNDFKISFKKIDPQKNQQVSVKDQELKFDQFIVSQGKITFLEELQSQEIKKQHVNQRNSRQKMKGHLKHQSQDISFSSKQQLNLNFLKNELIKKENSNFNKSLPDYSPVKLNSQRNKSTMGTFSISNNKNQKINKRNSKRIEDLKPVQTKNHKRSVTESEENIINQLSFKFEEQKLRKIANPFKKTLHRISQNLTQSDLIQQNQQQSHLIQQNQYNSKKSKTTFCANKVILPLKQFQKNINQQPSLKRASMNVLTINEIQNVLQNNAGLNDSSRNNEKEFDFDKQVEKILKNVDLRKMELLKQNYTLKQYLISYYKCTYGKQLYYSFVKMLQQPKNSSLEFTFCFNALLNTQVSALYLIDLFKMFVLVVDRCAYFGIQLINSSNQPEIVRYILNMYLQEQQIQQYFQENQKINQTVIAHFVRIERMLMVHSIQSQLYCFCIEVFPENYDSISFQIVEELTYFLNYKAKDKDVMRAKLYLKNSMYFHRFCLFCFKFNWNQLLEIKAIVQSEYETRKQISCTFDSEEEIIFIKKHKNQLNDMPNLKQIFENSLRKESLCGKPINKHLLMLLKMTIVQKLFRNNFCLSNKLKLINVAFEGLEKKRYLNEIASALKGHPKETRL